MDHLDEQKHKESSYSAMVALSPSYEAAWLPICMTSAAGGKTEMSLRYLEALEVLQTEWASWRC